MAKVYKDDKGKYYVKYWKNGKSATKRGFTTKQEAQYFITKLQTKEVDTCFMHFKDMVKEYRETYYRDRVTYGTYKRTEIFFENYIFPNFPNKCMNAIVPLDCLNFYNTIKKIDKSTGYKNDIISAFKGVFDYAHKFHQLLTDPTVSLERYKKTAEEKMKTQDKEFQIWSVEEFKLFIDKVEKPIYKLIFKILFILGLRKGEMFALTWNDIKEHRVRINKSLTRKAESGYYEIKEPKNIHSIRTLYIPDDLYNELMMYKEIEERVPGFNNEWFVFGRTKPIAENTLTREKDRAIEKSRVKPITIHEFRHSCASILIGRNINIVTVSRMLGHSDIETTLKTYAHLIKENENILNSELEKINKTICINELNYQNKKGEEEILYRSKPSQNILKNNQAKRKALV